MNSTDHLFQTLILNWFDSHGRTHLPWQQDKTPYRVWISEIMLQQTQVNTVIPYFNRFLQRFPDLISLAKASEDEVLHLWAGLGYYSRARNLLRTAQILVDQLDSRFPQTLAALQQLPGIGQSTAGAILAIAFNQVATILDGNVKRVLTRFYAITEAINDKTTEKKLWERAKQLTPNERVADYTQAMMDLGATVCLRTQPVCQQCPVIKQCAAYQQDLVNELPTKRAKSRIPIRTATFLVLKKNDAILLQKRPPIGIWGGLWSLPELASKPSHKAIQLFCRKHFQLSEVEYVSLKSFRHTFSHYHLDIFPVLIEIKKIPAKIMEAAQQIWYNPNHPQSIGLPKPIQVILHDTSYSLPQTK